MLVGVIIPIYNVKPYLVEALDSVMHQTYKELEILVICKYTVHNTLKQMKYKGRERMEPGIEAGRYDRVSTLRAMDICKSDETSQAISNGGTR